MSARRRAGIKAGVQRNTNRTVSVEHSANVFHRHDEASLPGRDPTPTERWSLRSGCDLSHRASLDHSTTLPFHDLTVAAISLLADSPQRKSLRHGRQCPSREPAAEPARPAGAQSMNRIGWPTNGAPGRGDEGDLNLQHTRPCGARSGWREARITLVILKLPELNDPQRSTLNMSIERADGFLQG